MIEARRRAYLHALGFDVWLARTPAAEHGLLGVGDGRGSTLLICQSAADQETELAADLSRALGGEPVWAWLDPGADDDSQALEDIIDSRLITRVLLFGPEPGRNLFRGTVPQIIGSATVSVAPAMDQLAVSAPARKALWRQLRNLPVLA